MRGLRRDPDYEILRIRTGQWIPGLGQLRSAEFRPVSRNRLGRSPAPGTRGWLRCGRHTGGLGRFPFDQRAGESNLRGGAAGALRCLLGAFEQGAQRPLPHFVVRQRHAGKRGRRWAAITPSAPPVAKGGRG